VSLQNTHTARLVALFVSKSVHVIWKPSEDTKREPLVTLGIYVVASSHAQSHSHERTRNFRQTLGLACVVQWIALK